MYVHHAHADARGRLEWVLWRGPQPGGSQAVERLLAPTAETLGRTTGNFTWWHVAVVVLPILGATCSQHGAALAKCLIETFVGCSTEIAAACLRRHKWNIHTVMRHSHARAAYMVAQTRLYNSLCEKSTIQSACAGPRSILGGSRRLRTARACEQWFPSFLTTRV